MFEPIEREREKIRQEVGKNQPARQPGQTRRTTKVKIGTTARSQTKQGRPVVSECRNKQKRVKKFYAAKIHIHIHVGKGVKKSWYEKKREGTSNREKKERERKREIKSVEKILNDFFSGGGLQRLDNPINYFISRSSSVNA